MTATTIEPQFTGNRTANVGSRALGMAIGLGVLGDLLFYHSPAPGLNLLLWAVALVLASRLGRPGTVVTGQRAWQLVALGFASCLVIRDADFLRGWNLLAMVLSFGLASLGWIVADPRHTRVRDIALAVIHVLASIASGVFLLARTTPGQSGGRVRRWGPIALGVLLAVPIILIFGALFSSADPAFAALMDIDLGALPVHLVIIGALAWLSAGVLRAWLWKPRVQAVPDALATPPAIDTVAIGIALGTMTMLFLLFVSIQVRYLFGGEAMIRSLANLTYAEYARRGFFEMVTATGLVVPILFVADVLASRGSARARQSLHALGAVQLMLTLAVCASAVSRLGLYVGAYGLTTDRIVASAMLAWLTACVVLFANTVLRGRPDRFCYGAMVAGLITLGGLNAVNPEYLIARVNLSRTNGDAVDGDYLKRLGADAAPWILAHPDLVPAASRCRTLATIQHAWATADADWRSWNVARTRAIAAARATSPPAECAAAR